MLSSRSAGLCVFVRPSAAGGRSFMSGQLNQLVPATHVSHNGEAPCATESLRSFIEPFSAVGQCASRWIETRRLHLSTCDPFPIVTAGTWPTLGATLEWTCSCLSLPCFEGRQKRAKQQRDSGQLLLRVVENGPVDSIRTLKAVLCRRFLLHMHFPRATQFPLGGTSSSERQASPFRATPRMRHGSSFPAVFLFHQDPLGKNEYKRTQLLLRSAVKPPLRVSSRRLPKRRRENDVPGERSASAQY